MSLKVRLALGLPVLHIITGVIVAGLSGDTREGVAALGLDVLVAVAVAFTLAFELTLLLTRSIIGPLRDLQAATERVAAEDLRARVPVTSTHEAGRLTQAFNRMVAGLQERATLHQAFGACVDPDVTERVLAEATHERLSGEHARWISRPAIPLRGKRDDVRLHAPEASRFMRANSASSVSAAR